MTTVLDLREMIIGFSKYHFPKSKHGLFKFLSKPNFKNFNCRENLLDENTNETFSLQIRVDIAEVLFGLTNQKLYYCHCSLCMRSSDICDYIESGHFDDKFDSVCLDLFQMNHVKCIQYEALFKGRDFCMWVIDEDSEENRETVYSMKENISQLEI